MTSRQRFGFVTSVLIAAVASATMVGGFMSADAAGAGDTTPAPTPAPQPNTDAGAGSSELPECKVELGSGELQAPTFEERASQGLTDDDARIDWKRSWYGTSNVTDELYLAIGPDGAVLGSVPPTIREDATVVIAVFHPIGITYDVQITGCDRTDVRVLGSTGSGGPPKPAPLRTGHPTKFIPDLQGLGHCNADKQVSVQVKVTDKDCTPKTTTTTFQTVAVYNLTVGYGEAFFGGYRDNVGVDVGAGGVPNKAYSRRVRRGLSDRLLLGWFPFGYSPALDVFENAQGQKWLLSLARHMFLGTLIDLSEPLSSLNLNVGIEPVQGLSIFAGVDFCDKETMLGGGLVNGSIFNDDSSKLPTTTSFRCNGHGYFGAAATLDLLGKLFHK
jgi:hypothetical protein